MRRGSTERTGLPVGTLYRLARLGEIPHHWEGRQLRFRARDLGDSWLAPRRSGVGSRRSDAQPRAAGCSGPGHAARFGDAASVVVAGPLSSVVRRGGQQNLL